MRDEDFDKKVYVCVGIILAAITLVIFIAAWSAFVADHPGVMLKVRHLKMICSALP